MLLMLALAARTVRVALTLLVVPLVLLVVSVAVVVVVVHALAALAFELVVVPRRPTMCPQRFVVVCPILCPKPRLLFGVASCVLSDAMFPDLVVGFCSVPRQHASHTAAASAARIPRDTPAPWHSVRGAWPCRAHQIMGQESGGGQADVLDSVC